MNDFLLVSDVEIFLNRFKEILEKDYHNQNGLSHGFDGIYSDEVYDYVKSNLQALYCRPIKYDRRWKKNNCRQI